MVNRRRMKELKAKFQRYEETEPAIWKWSPCDSAASEKKVETFLHHLDKVAGSTVERYGSDWAIDRPVAKQLLELNRPFVFLPRRCGSTIFVPGRFALANYQAYSNMEEASGLRFIYVVPNDEVPYIMENRAACDTFMLSRPDMDDLSWFADDENAYTVVEDSRHLETKYLAVKGYSRILMTGEVLKVCDSLYEAEQYIKGLDPGMEQTAGIFRKKEDNYEPKKV